MILSCTQKLMDAYKIKSPEQDEPCDEMYSWHMDLFYVDRRKCIILMNDATKLCVTLFDISQKDFDKNLIDLWLRSFLATATHFRISPNAIEQYINDCLSGDCIPFTKTSNRSIVSYMVKCKSRIKRIVYNYIRDGVLHSMEINDWLNSYPIASEDYDYPFIIFANALKEKYGFDTHSMKLDPEPFQKIASGTKHYEIRLNDEKRQKICTSDEIVFINNKSGQQLRRSVQRIEDYPSFRELFRDFSPSALGCEKDCTEADFVAQMRQYYSPKEESKHGVLAIQLKSIDNAE